VASTYLVRFPGGDTRILKWLTSLVPRRRFSKYVEPFVGGTGALLYWVATNGLAGEAVIGDSDPAILSVWLCMLDETCREEALELVRGLELSAAHFYEVARIRNSLVRGLREPVANPVLAAFEVWIRAYSYGGHVTNPHYSNVEKLPAPEKIVERIRRFVSGVSRIRIRVVFGDWSRTVQYADSSSLVYLDPPHHNAHSEIRMDVGPRWSLSDLRRLVRWVEDTEATVLLKYRYSRDAWNEICRVMRCTIIETQSAISNNSASSGRVRLILAVRHGARK